MADNGRDILTTYSAACETIRGTIPKITDPMPGDIIFFSGTRHSGANHIGIIYKVDSSTIYTVEGNTSGQSGVIDNGGEVATKSYDKSYSRILSYGRPKYDLYSATASDVLVIALGEVGYVEKKSNADLNSKTGNAGKSNYTKYGQWIGANGDYWCASFVSWCFHAAYDESADVITYLDEVSESYLASLDIEYEPSAVSKEEGSGSSDDDTIYAGQFSGNSSLVSYVNRLSSGKKRQRTSNISRITIHTAKAIGDIHDLALLLNSSDRSYNYGIDNDGVIGLFMDEAAWTSSSDNNSNDKVSINIICMNETLEPNYKISESCYNSLIRLLEDVCRRNFIWKLTFTDHPKRDSVTLHRQFNKNSECPGKYVENHLHQILDEVNAILDTEVGVNFVQRAVRLAENQTEALKAQSTVALKNIKPYVVQPSPTELNVNYIALKELGVIGVMLDAGQRFNAKHEKVTYRTDNVYAQTLEVKASTLPHGYIYTTRAQSEADVKEEAYWLYFIISKYPPKLGIWLRCKFDVSDSIAQELVERWYRFFVEWGLKSKCGLYATSKQAKKIGWPKQCAYMPLWLEGQLTENVCPDEEILTPSFFKMDRLINEGYSSSTAVIESTGVNWYNDRAAEQETATRYVLNIEADSIDEEDQGNITMTSKGISISSGWTGPKLTKQVGRVLGPNGGQETYYNLPMSGCIKLMKDLGFNAEYWEREDGVKMYGQYIMVAANLTLFPKGSIVPTTLGEAMVCDTGTFALVPGNEYNLDIAVNW